MPEKITSKFDSTDSMLTNAEQHTLHEAKNETRENHEAALNAIKADLPSFIADMKEYILDLQTLITVGGKASLQDDSLLGAYNTIKKNNPDLNLPELVPYLETEEGKKGLEEKAKFSDNSDIKDAIAEGNAAIEKAKEDEKKLEEEIEKAKLPDGDGDKDPIVKEEGDGENQEGEVVSENIDYGLSSLDMVSGTDLNSLGKLENDTQGNQILTIQDNLPPKDIKKVFSGKENVTVILSQKDLTPDDPSDDCTNCNFLKNSIKAGEVNSTNKGLIVIIEETKENKLGYRNALGIDNQKYGSVSYPLVTNYKLQGKKYLPDYAYYGVTKASAIGMMQDSKENINIGVKICENCKTTI